MSTICSTCGEPIEHRAPVAIGPDGKSHADCAKRATAHGKSIDLFEAFDEISRLKKRVQELEAAVERLDHLSHYIDRPIR